MTLVYVAMEDALLVAGGEGDDWVASTALSGHDLECVAASPAAPHRVFVGTFSSGLFRSTDGGETFEQVIETVWDAASGHSLAGDPVTAVTVSPHDPGVVWVGTEPSALYRSIDAGESFDRLDGLTDVPSAAEWSFPPRPDTHHVRWIAVDPNEPQRLLVGVEAGTLLLTDDGGETWQDRPPGSRRDNHQLATHPDAPGLVYAAAGDGFAESRDGGASWEHPQRGLDHRYVWSAAADPGDPDTVLVSAASGAHRAHSIDGAESYLYRRSPGRGGGPDGTAWTALDDRGIPTGRGVLRAVLAPGHRAGELFAVNNHGVYRTENAGGRWRPVPLSWPDGFAEQTCRGLAVV